MITRSILFLFFLITNHQVLTAQFTRADTLRGSVGEGRQKWDVMKYNITVKPNIDAKTISGKNIITYFDRGVIKMQIDLQHPMIIDSIVAEKKHINFRRDGNIYWVFVRDTNAVLRIKPGVRELTIYFQGKPIEAQNPPWDGGWIWKKDKEGHPFVSVACQGLGASVWYPCKDHQSDEPDSAELHIITPSELTGVGNGRLKNKLDNNDGTTTYSWAVTNPINNYNIIPYIGKYANFTETFAGEKGKLDMSYWVLESNLQKAKKHFKDAARMMKAFEYWFGPYPFYNDGYKLVEAPHPGMEHQSAIAYGNEYQNGFIGRGDLSETGWGLKWDFMIIHESGHEWFGNNITTKDIADMWVHESFTNYSETLFTEFYYGKKAGSEYVKGLRKKIRNDIPIIGLYDVNKEGSTDMYYKGSNMLHTIRQVINDDEKFRNILRGLNKKFYHQTVTGKQIEEYITRQSGKDLSKIFYQYLRTTMIPTLEYKIDKGIIFYKWSNVVKGFNMPLRVSLAKNKFIFIYPTENFKQIKMAYKHFTIDENFYIRTNKS